MFKRERLQKVFKVSRNIGRAIALSGLIELGVYGGGFYIF